MLPNSTLGEGCFSTEAAANSQQYMRHLHRRLQTEFYEERKRLNEAQFALEAQKRQQAREQARERYLVKAPSVGQMNQLLQKFGRKKF